MTTGLEPAGREVPIAWKGRRLRAFVPTPLAERDLTLGVDTVTRTATAAAGLAHAAGRLGAEYEPLARLLLRAEGVASSYIEGVRAPVVDVVLAEDAPHSGGTASWIASNLSAVASAVADAPDSELTAPELCRWHATLMAGSPTPERHVGRLRREQGWIGGTDPTNAHLVTPPPDAVPELIDDLVRYANRLDVDPIAQAGIAHAQFEVIHPYADGNGRVGRILVAWSLCRRLKLLTPPPISVAMAADVGGYTAGLTLFRLADHERWVRWFAEAVERGASAQIELIGEVETLRRRWLDRLSAAGGGSRALRADAVVWRLLELLPRHLVLTSEIVSQQLGVTRKAAISALERAVAAGVLTDYGSLARGRGRPTRIFVSHELLGLLGANPLRV